MRLPAASEATKPTSNVRSGGGVGYVIYHNMHYAALSAYWEGEGLTQPQRA